MSKNQPNKTGQNTGYYDTVRRKRELEEERKLTESGVVRIICEEFRIPIRIVRFASFSYTGEEHLTIQGLEDATQASFPARLELVRYPKEKEIGGSYRQLVTKPISLPVFSRFFASKNLIAPKPLMMIHVQTKFNINLAVTNLPMNGGVNCTRTIFMKSDVLEKQRKWHGRNFHIDFNNSIWPESVWPETITSGNFIYLLQAIRKKKLWMPKFT